MNKYQRYRENKAERIQSERHALEQRVNELKLDNERLTLDNYRLIKENEELRAALGHAQRRMKPTKKPRGPRSTEKHKEYMRKWHERRRNEAAIEKAEKEDSK